MPDVTFSEQDILTMKELPAGWYPMSMTSCSEGPGTKDPSSTTWTCEFEVVDGPFKGAIIPTWFSNKMIKNIGRYIRCFVANIAANQSYPLDSTIGKPVMGYVVFNMDRASNEIKDFKPVGK